MIFGVAMRFNELAIETAILEAETIKSLSNLQEKQRVDEVAPLIFAGAMWALTFGISWLSQELVLSLINNWQQSGWRPDPNSIPSGTKVVIEDSSTGQRINFEYRNGQWQGQRATIRNGRVVSVSSSMSPLTQAQMAPILERAANQRQGWFSRLFRGRNSFNGLGFDFRDVSEADFNRAVRASQLASDPRLRNSQELADLREKLRTETQANPTRANRAKQWAINRIERSNMRLVTVVANLGFGLGALYYEVNELEEIYRQRVRDGEIEYSDYQRLHEELKNSVQNIVGQIIMPLSAAAVGGIIAGAVISKIPYLRALRGWPRTITAATISAAGAAVVLSDEARRTVIQFLSDFYFLDDTRISSHIDQYTDRFLEFLGFEDLATQQGRERDEAEAERTGDLDRPRDEPIDIRSVRDVLGLQ